MELKLLTMLVFAVLEDSIRFYCCARLLKPKNGRWGWYLPLAASFLLYYPLSIYWYMIDAKPTFIGFLLALFSVLVAVTCFDGKREVNLFYLWTANLVAATGSSIVLAASGFAGISADILSVSTAAQLPGYCLRILCALVLDAALGLLAIRLLPKAAKWKAVVWAVVVLGGIGLLAEPVAIWLLDTFSSRAAQQDPIGVILMGSLECLLAVVLAMTAKALYEDRKRHVLELKNDGLQREIQLYFEEFQRLRQRDEALHKMRHDHFNHLQTLFRLLKTEEQGAQTYLSELLKREEEIQPDLCAHPVANAVLCSKRAECEQWGIPFACGADLPERLNMDDVDMTCALANLLDNAIAASRALPPGEREIVTSAALHGEMLIIKVENRGRLTATPPREAGHGWGRSILRDVARRYEGDFRLAEEDGHVSAVLILHCPKEAVRESR